MPAPSGVCTAGRKRVRFLQLCGGRDPVGSVRMPAALPGGGTCGVAAVCRRPEKGPPRQFGERAFSGFPEAPAASSSLRRPVVQDLSATRASWHLGVLVVVPRPAMLVCLTVARVVLRRSAAARQRTRPRLFRGRWPLPARSLRLDSRPAMAVLATNDSLGRRSVRAWLDWRSGLLGISVPVPSKMSLRAPLSASMSRRWHLEVTILPASAVFRPNLELRPGYRRLDLVCERPCASGAASENQPQASLSPRTSLCVWGCPYANGKRNCTGGPDAVRFPG